MKMKLHPLKLSVKLDGWRLFALRNADVSFVPVKEKVLMRDKNTCRFCGFQAEKYQEVVNLDGDYRNNKLDNLVTACCFCAQCFFLETVGKNEYGGGVVIYLPEVTQAEINGFCHVLFYAIASNSTSQEDAQNIYRTLKMRSKIVEQYLGEGLSTPSVLGQILLESRINNREQVASKVLEKLRLLPARDKFSTQIAAWVAEAAERRE